MTYRRGHWQILLLGLVRAQAGEFLLVVKAVLFRVAAQQGDFLRRQGPWLPRAIGLQLR